MCQPLRSLRLHPSSRLHLCCLRARPSGRHLCSLHRILRQVHLSLPTAVGASWCLGMLGGWAGGELVRRDQVFDAQFFTDSILEDCHFVTKLCPEKASVFSMAMLRRQLAQWVEIDFKDKICPQKIPRSAAGGTAPIFALETLQRVKPGPTGMSLSGDISLKQTESPQKNGDILWSGVVSSTTVRNDTAQLHSPPGG